MTCSRCHKSADTRPWGQHSHLCFDCTRTAYGHFGYFSLLVGIMLGAFVTWLVL